MFKVTGAALAASLAFSAQAFAADAPAEIKIGTLYASSGTYASISKTVNLGLSMWVEQKNAEGRCKHRSNEPGYDRRIFEMSMDRMNPSQLQRPACDKYGDAINHGHPLLDHWGVPCD